MKAEHRKELETNILADRVGKFIVTAKKGPSRSSVYYVLIGLVLLVILFFIYRFYVRKSETQAQAWMFLEDGGIQYASKIAEGNNAQKAVRFQIAWVLYWRNGVQRLGAGNGYVAGMDSIGEAEKLYSKLESECKGDPVFHPEALYGLAVILETRAIEDRNNLDLALDKFKEIAKTYPDSAFGQLSRKRADQLENEAELANIKRFYHSLETTFKPRPKDQFFPGLGVPDGHPPIVPPPVFPKINDGLLPDAPKTDKKDDKKDGVVPPDLKKAPDAKLPEPPKTPEEKKTEVPPAKTPEPKKAEDAPPAKKSAANAPEAPRPPATPEAKAAPVPPPPAVDPKK